MTTQTPDDSVRMTASIEDDNLVIRVPLDLLIWSQEHRDDPIYVVDKVKMCTDLQNRILDYGGNDDLGSTAFEDFLDNFFYDSLENGELYLEGWWERNESEE
jgi:hypothetical protein